MGRDNLWLGKEVIERSSGKSLVERVETEAQCQRAEVGIPETQDMRKSRLGTGGQGVPRCLTFYVYFSGDETPPGSSDKSTYCVAEHRVDREFFFLRNKEEKK